MTEKRFEIIGVGYTNIDVPTYIVEYGNGEDDCFNLYESKEDSQKVVDLLNELNDENEQLKQQINKLEAQLHCPFDSICIQCNNEYLVQTEKYYISKCKKGHEQCSKVDVKYCDDFELKGDVE